MTEMTEELRERLVTLETKHEERHHQVQTTLSRIATAVETIADNQNKMVHLGSRIDRLEDEVADDRVKVAEMTLKFAVLETRHKIIWGGMGTVGIVALGAIAKAWGLT